MRACGSYTRRGMHAGTPNQNTAGRPLLTMVGAANNSCPGYCEEPAGLAAAYDPTVLPVHIYTLHAQAKVAATLRDAPDWLK